ncbi:hypothetical protein LINPERPRIM_LOCUS14797, partial [Linum perenne]
LPSPPDSHSHLSPHSPATSFVIPPPPSHPPEPFQPLIPCQYFQELTFIRGAVTTSSPSPALSSP